MKEHNLVIVATPHQIVHLAIDIECLEVDLGGHLTRHDCILLLLVASHAADSRAREEH